MLFYLEMIRFDKDGNTNLAAVPQCKDSLKYLN